MLAAVGDVNPVGGGTVLVLAMLHDALVEGCVVDNPFHPFATFGKTWDAEVGCFALHVLGVCYSTYSLVEVWTTIAG